VIEKMETLERDHHYLLTKLHKAELYPDIAGRQSNPSKGSSVIEYLSMLDEGMLWDLAEVYKRDLDLFGYRPHMRVRNDPSKQEEREDGQKMEAAEAILRRIFYMNKG